MGIYRFIQERMTRNMRAAYLKALLRQEIGFFDDPINSSAGLTSSLSKQTQLVASITGLGLGSTIGSICALVTGISLAFTACWRVALAMLGGVPLVAASMAVIVKLMLTDEGSGGGGAYCVVQCTVVL